MIVGLKVRAQQGREFREGSISLSPVSGQGKPAASAWITTDL
jgi:hypothetical protein